MAQVKRIKEGVYRIRVSKGTGVLRHIINKTYRGKLADANRLARDMESELDRGRSPLALLPLLKYAEHWRRRAKASDSTRDFYESVVRLYAEPLHALPLFKITGPHIQAVYDAMEVSPNTVRHLHSTLRAMFNYAVKKGHLSESPCKHVDLPAKETPEITYLTEDEAVRFVAACQNHPRGLIFEFALETGMRPGEYLALRRSDINFVYGHASVNRTASRDGKRFKKPKTDKSRRVVPLSYELIGKLSAHLETHPHELVFCTEAGTAYQQKNLTRDLPKLTEKEISLYSLRHTCATLLLSAGVNPKIVADRLGHSGVTTTLDKYSHVLPHIQEAATDKLSGILRGAQYSRTPAPIEADSIN